MTASTNDLLRLRRMVAEMTNTTYNDATIRQYLESYPLIDGNGKTVEDDDWVAAYDLHAAAADIWEEKAAGVAHQHDFSADGATYQSSQVNEMYMDKARYHRARATAKVKAVHKKPDELNDSALYLRMYANIDPPGEDTADDLQDLLDI